VSARHIAQKVKAPLAPGTSDPASSADEIVAFAKEHGVPVAIKAAHGGGGRGLKVAYTLEEIPEQFESATREALAAFGRRECFVEKYLEQPRHVETQCLADSAGNVVVISTRDCSLQRRHQKLVEEAPAPFLTKEQETLLYESSKAILKEAGYIGAGTCEFLIGKDGNHFFPRGQHPFTGRTPRFGRNHWNRLGSRTVPHRGGRPDRIRGPTHHGHSIEFRINGEDPGRGFLPTPGPIHSVRFPGGPGVRVDSGITTGDVITGAFDSLLAKLIVTGGNQAGCDRKSASRPFRV